MSRVTLSVPFLAAAVFACSGARYGGPEGSGPGITLPARFAEGDTSDEKADAGASDAAVAPPVDAESPVVRYGGPPDPEPLRLNTQWEYEISYIKGDVHVTRVTPRRFAQPVVTARNMGRFAIELWIGSELIDRVRFDFPLLAAEAPIGKRRPLHDPPTLAAGADAIKKVLVPASPRATRAVLLDRATGRTVPLPWPPDRPLTPHDSGLERDAGTNPGAAELDGGPPVAPAAPLHADGGTQEP